MNHFLALGRSLCVRSRLLGALTLAFAALPFTASAAPADHPEPPAHASHAAPGAPVAPAEPPAAHFKAGHGLQFTAKARAFAELKTGEVVSQRFGQNPEVPAIPLTALLRTIKGDFVYVANGEWFLRTAVTTGARSATHIEIKDGLYEGDTVVIQGVRILSLAEIQALNGGTGCAGGH
jgi:hypothetical protein